MMSERYYYSLAQNDFGKVRKKELVMRLLNFLKPQKDRLLSLGDVRSLLKPESEHYKGMQAIPIAKIVGSEGRTNDFNRAFLPRHDNLMRRWLRVDVAHYGNIDLPAITCFEIGGLYFVRDGNHRVSVAKSRGADFIDAEVVSLSSEITLHPDMSQDELKSAVVDFERRKFCEETKLCELRPDCRLEFSEVGRYEELLSHIREHKWYLNLNKEDEIPFTEAVLSWYDNVYMPTVRVIRDTKLLARFPQTTESELYVFIGKHWSELGRRYGPLFTLEEAAEDLSQQRRHSRIARFFTNARRLFSRSKGPVSAARDPGNPPQTPRR
jgi:hypothetical protein